LLLRSVEGTTWQRAVRAGTPGFGGEDGLGFNPVPTEGGMHLGMGYGGEGAMVPYEQGQLAPGSNRPGPRGKARLNGTGGANCPY